MLVTTPGACLCLSPCRRQGTAQAEGSNPTNGNSSGNGYSVKDSNTATNTGTNGNTNGNGNGYSCGEWDGRRERESSCLHWFAVTSGHVHMWQLVLIV